MPTLLLPTNGTALAAGTASVTLQWSAVSGVSRYNVQLWTGRCGGTNFDYGPATVFSTSMAQGGCNGRPRAHKTQADFPFGSPDVPANRL